LAPICTEQQAAVAPVSSRLVRKLGSGNDSDRDGELVEIENRASLRHALLSGINIFVGAGFSVLARDRDGSAMPVGPQLGDELRDRFGVDVAKSLNLAQLYTVLARTHKDEVDSFLRTRFRVDSYDERYEAMRRVAIKTWFTTNIDDLPHRIFEGSQQSYLNDLDINGPAHADRRSIDLVMLHGAIFNMERPLRFGAVEIASSFNTDPDRWRYLRHRLQTAPTLFLGYSLQDAAALESLSTENGQTLSETWIQVRPSAEVAGTADYFRALGFQLIGADTAQFLNYIVHDLPPEGSSLPRDRSKAKTRDLFPSDSVPEPSEVPSRPVADFFRGFAPGWSDVFSQTVRRVSHYRTIVESIRASRPTIVTGIPGSGKTTLLMQIVAGLEFDGHKILLDGSTNEKAEMVVRALDGAPALVAVDNITNHVEAFNVFQRAPNVTVIAADRDYNLSSSLHRLNRREANIIDVTELSDADQQDLRASIPADVRRSTPRMHEISKGTRPSLFEFVQSNVDGPTLRQRMRTALIDMEKTDPLGAEMLLLTAYVHSCRTPLSMDMAIGYWSSRIKSHSDIYAQIKSVGSLLSEYEGDLTESEQDHFAARSVLVAESVIAAASGVQLAEMLTRFHSNISHTRVASYYVFKRRAYDSKLFGRAFSNLSDGLELYDDIYARDPSPYTLQQKALFLASRKKYSEAFEVMDRAMSTAKRANWTIRSSYAQILFRANEELAGEDNSIRELLDRAMAILTECYQGDRRRSMHAVQYSTLAVRYAKIFSDERAVEYLKQGDLWLSEVIHDEPWVRGATFLQRDVRAQLRDLPQ
jgi:hypothetical protein